VESRDVNLWLNQTYGEYEGLSPPSQLSTVVHVPLTNDADNLQELENIENVPPPPNVPATIVPPSDLVAFSFKEFLFSSFSLPFGPYFLCSCSYRKMRKHDSEHFPCFPAPEEA